MMRIARGALVATIALALTTSNAEARPAHARIDERSSAHLALDDTTAVSAPALSGDAPYPCTYTAADGGYFDLSGLTVPTFIKIEDTTDAAVFQVNVCAPVKGQSSAAVGEERERMERRADRQIREARSTAW
jgi:hypothetical protein